jgi:glucose-6-phosphate 1-dehydrogenase
MNNELLKEYADIQIKIKELTTRKDEIQEEVLNATLENDGKIESEYGNFTIRVLKRYTYPQYVLDAEEDYKGLKAKAEELEEATYVEMPSLTFKALKI